MFVKGGEIQAGQGEGLYIVEGGKIVKDPGERIRNDPTEVVVLGEIQSANVIAGCPQAILEPRLEVGEGVQLNIGEKVAATPMDPARRDEGAQEKALGVSDEHVDYFLDDL